MANFPNQQLTDAGWDVLSEALAGRRLTFTKMSVGDGLLDGADIEKQTNLINRLYDLPLVNYRPGGQGKVFITANLRSSDVTNGFWLREIGLWCRIEGNPVEILYSLCNSGDQSDYVPGKLTDPGETVVIHAIEIQVIIAKAANVEVEVITGLTDGRNVGTGAGIFRVREGNILTFKSLVGGRGPIPIKVEEEDEEIIFSVAAGVNGDGGNGEEGPAIAVITTGCCIPFFGQTAPAGYLMCDGSAHPVEDFPRLYGVIGRTYTPTSWSEDLFAVPDCRCRALVGTGGLDYDPGFNLSLGQKYGLRLVTLEAQHLAAHTHTVDINHYHNITTGGHNHGDPGHAHYGNYLHAHTQVAHSHPLAWETNEARANEANPGGWIWQGWDYGVTYGSGNIARYTYNSSSVAPGINANYASGWTDTRGCGLYNAGNLGGNTNWVSDMAGNWNVRTTSASGNGASVGHENMQPSLGVNYLIKT